MRTKPEMRFTPPRRARRRMVGLVMPLRQANDPQDEMAMHGAGWEGCALDVVTKDLATAPATGSQDVAAARLLHLDCRSRQHDHLLFRHDGLLLDSSIAVGDSLCATSDSLLVGLGSNVLGRLRRRQLRLVVGRVLRVAIACETELAFDAVAERHQRRGTATASRAWHPCRRKPAHLDLSKSERL